MWLARRKPGVPTQAIRTELVPCSDEDGRRSALIVGLTADGHVTLTSPHGDTAVLEPLEAGPLRASLRSAVVAADVRAVRVER